MVWEEDYFFFWVASTKFVDFQLKVKILILCQSLVVYLLVFPKNCPIFAQMGIACEVLQLSTT